MEKLISVIVPCYNEEENVPYFYEEFIKNEPYFEAHEIGFELWYIDDGSRDGTLSEIRKLQEAADGPAESEATAEDSGEKAPASSGETSPAAEAASGNAASPEASEEAVPAGAIIPGRAEKTSEDAGEPAESAPGAAEEYIPAEHNITRLDDNH